LSYGLDFYASVCKPGSFNEHFPIKAARQGFFFVSFLLCPGIKEKSILSQTSMKKAVPDFSGTAE